MVSSSQGGLVTALTEAVGEKNSIAASKAGMEPPK
jgi:hypothetical protein